MKKVSMVLIFLFTSFLSAEVIEANYKVEFGIFGKIGIANALLTKTKNLYVIDVELKATGLAKTLSGNRKEQHISKGHIENGMMVSDLYQVIKSHGSKTVNKVYRINHKTKTVTKEYKYWKNGKLKEDSNSTMDYYSKDDLLTLYFNLDKKILDKKEAKSYTFKAIGAEKQHGIVDVIIPSKNELKEYEESLGENKNSWYARAIINQNIFSSDKGELLLRIGNDGITQKAVLKDLIFFGDIRAIRL
ncbi:hypothetical protein MNB_SV-13-1158 [hydrothermal vent metagenome]|uniref:DUF3108 domain-containing protein n=1 Tax=hydrothermal vent metagenome TaxID=652676 RepID=A0A1W1C5R5_9ZZZZ